MNDVVTNGFYTFHKIEENLKKNTKTVSRKKTRRLNLA